MKPKIKQFLPLILLSFAVLSVIPLPVQAGEVEYTLPTTDIADLYTQWAPMDHVESAFHKFNASELPLGYSVKTATLYVKCQSVVGSNEWQIWYVDNQDWDENDGGLMGLSRTNAANYSTSFVVEQWEAFDITSIMQINYAAGLSNFSIYIEESEYPIDPGDYGNAMGTPWHIQIGVSNQSTSLSHWMYYYSHHEVSPNVPANFPYVSVVINTQPPYIGGLGYNFNIEIQPATIVPSAMIGYRSADSAFYGGFRPMETDDGEFSVLSSPSTTYQTITLEYHSSYSYYADKLIYDLLYSGGDNNHVYIFDYDPGETLIDDGTFISGTHTIEDANWLEGRMQVKLRRESTVSSTLNLKIDQLAINFTTISQTYTGERIWNGTEYLEKIWVPVLEPDTNITIDNVPENYDLVNVLPYCNNSRVGQTLTLFNTAPTTYEIVFSTSLTRPDLVTIVLNYYINGTNEPLPANTLNSSYVVTGTEYRIEPYTSRFIWDKDDGNVTIHSYDYFRRLLVNQSFEIPEDTIFYVIDVGLELYRLTIHCNTMATLNITNSLNESYYPAFEVSPENATLIKTLWLYGENLTVTTHSNDYGDLTHIIDPSITSFANFKYRIPVKWHGERQMPAGQSALYQTIRTIVAASFLGVVGYLVGYYLRKHRIAEKIDKHLL